MDSALRPRDIQARIRSGETPEAVASLAQVSVDKIMPYCVPVLAEREHVAELARRSHVRRKNVDGPARRLTDVVAERLRGRSVDPGSASWDAWRRDDGRWTLVADYRSGESARHAEFVFDAPGRYVVADDDEARWLVGEQTAVKGPQPRTTPGPRRLSAVSNDDELPLGEDAIEMVTEDPVAPPVAEVPVEIPVEVAEDTTEDLSATAAAVRATGDADWIATERPTAPTVPDEPEPVELGSEADEPADEPAEDAAPRRPAKKKSRASVPSWDEIMFGGKRD
jgi:hypothetical protein